MNESIKYVYVTFHQHVTTIQKQHFSNIINQVTETKSLKPQVLDIQSTSALHYITEVLDIQSTSALDYITEVLDIQSTSALDYITVHI
jgi:hypothetical protein